mmetsp:Transcript_36970/g.72744  ORF Transcript_36970/g.72744 Transcript_36970/m.72744 type:complete len:241 (-) Transcript_36970:1339-2061(-)
MNIRNAGSSAKTLGIIPCSELSENCTNVRFFISENTCAGSSPSSTFPPRSNRTSPFRTCIQYGIVPVSLVLRSESSRSAVRLCRKAGRGAGANSFLLRLRYVRRSMLPSDSGIMPVKLLLLKSRWVRARRLETYAGRSSLNALFCNARYSRTSFGGKIGRTPSSLFPLRSSTFSLSFLKNSRGRVPRSLLLLASRITRSSKYSKSVPIPPSNLLFSRKRPSRNGRDFSAVSSPVSSLSSR